MQEKLQLLKHSVPLLALLVIGVATLSINPLAAAKANNTNSCQLALIKNGGGNALLNSHLAWGDPVLKKELVNYNMKCTDTRHLLCVLIPNSMAHLKTVWLGKTNLDVANIRNTSPQLYNRLVDQYFLTCAPIVNRGATSRGGAIVVSR